MSDALTEYRHACEHASAFDVSQRGKVEVVGPDAAKFLHNLCTNDILGLHIGDGCEAFLTTAQARVVAPITAYRMDREPVEFQLDMDPRLANKVVKHLDRYLISEAVELADRTQEFGQLHLAGPQARQILETALGENLPDLDEWQHTQRKLGTEMIVHIRRRCPLALSGYDIVCPIAAAPAISQELLQAGAKSAGVDSYEILRVEAGTPEYGKDIDEERLAFDIGRNPGAICFTKGCYLGQEPIVMARDRGHANRKLLGLKITSGGIMPAGSKVFREGKEVGQVTSSVMSPRLGQPIALAYIRRGHQEPGSQVEVDEAGTRRIAEVSSLPFSGSYS